MEITSFAVIWYVLYKLHTKTRTELKSRVTQYATQEFVNGPVTNTETTGNEISARNKTNSKENVTKIRNRNITQETSTSSALSEEKRPKTNKQHAKDRNQSETSLESHKNTNKNKKKRWNNDRSDDEDMIPIKNNKTTRSMTSSPKIPKIAVPAGQKRCVVMWRDANYIEVTMGDHKKQNKHKKR